MFCKGFVSTEEPPAERWALSGSLPNSRQKVNNVCCCGGCSETWRKTGKCKTLKRKNLKPGQMSKYGPLCIQTSILDLIFSQ